MDLDSYQIVLEEVLIWLFSVEDIFQEQDDIFDDVEEVKDQFVIYEVNNLQLMSRMCLLWGFVFVGGFVLMMVVY